MVKKSIGYVRMEWTCTYCETRNPGPAKFCTACGKEQTEDVAFHQAAVDELITDEAEIARAKAGPDIHCPYCEARNPHGASFCGACGGDLSDAAVRKRGRVVGKRRKKAAPSIACSACGTPNPATARVCASCGESLALPQEEPPKKPAARPKRSRTGAMIGAGLLGVACIAAAYFLFFRTKDLTGVVHALSWTRSVGIEAYGPVEHEDFWDDIPSEAMIGYCEERLHHTEDYPVFGAVEVCGEEYVEDTGTGHGEVVQDCVYEVYQDYCTYTVDEWYEFDRVSLSGSDQNPAWPVVTLGEYQVEGTRSESYEIVFLAGGKRYTHTTSSASEFMQFTLGSEWILEVTGLGAVSSIEPAR
ncbi:MAG: zinc ribbon domain-containing protein [Anaerolineales bacterium]